jgi:uncharacterized protein YegJ (DUF2314 family)
MPAKSKSPIRAPAVAETMAAGNYDGGQNIMNKSTALLLASLTLLLASCNRQISRDSRDSNYARVTEKDADMNAAIAKAKATFSQFQSALREGKPSCTDFGVKKPYPTPSGGHEHMWIEDVKEVEGGFEGVIANDANDTRVVKNGQKVRFSASEISDWKYVDGGFLVGGYTIRYFTDRMSPEEKRALEKDAGFKIK